MAKFLPTLASLDPQQVRNRTHEIERGSFFGEFATDKMDHGANVLNVMNGNVTPNW